MIKDWSLEDQYIVEMIINYKGWTIVRKFKNIENEWKKNKSLVKLNDQLLTESAQVIIEIPILMT